MNPGKKPRPRRVSRSPFAHLWPDLSRMPSLDHWPNRSKPCDPDGSQVLNWIADQCECDIPVATRIFDAARHKGVITFNPETRLWAGTKGGRPYPHEPSVTIFQCGVVLWV